jgi:hypothetical protein
VIAAPTTKSKIGQPGISVASFVGNVPASQTHASNPDVLTTLRIVEAIFRPVTVNFYFSETFIVSAG